DFHVTGVQTCALPIYTYLLKLINYVHHLPLLANLAPHPAAWPYTSHHAYVSAARHTLVNTRTALQMLAARGGAEQAYQALMNRQIGRASCRKGWRIQS